MNARMFVLRHHPTAVCNSWKKGKRFTIWSDAFGTRGALGRGLSAAQAWQEAADHVAANLLADALVQPEALGEAAPR